MAEILDLTSLQKCAESLRSGVKIIENADWFESQSSEIQNLLLSGIVKNFEFVYEISIKMIKRFVELSALVPDEVDQMDFREILRTAAEIGIIHNVTVWFDFRKLRNTTAHTYDIEKAKHVESHSMGLLQSVDYLIGELKIRNEKQN